MFENSACLTLSVGKLSPYPSLIAGSPQVTGAALAVVEALLIVIMMMREPAQAEIDDIACGAISVALDRQRDTAILLWRINPTNRPALTFDTSLHIGLEEADHFPSLALEGPDPELNRGAIFLVQDEIGIVRLIRPIIMPRTILEGLAPLLVRQLSARRDRYFIQRHWGNIRRYYARKPDLARAFELAPIKGRAA